MDARLDFSHYGRQLHVSRQVVPFLHGRGVAPQPHYRFDTIDAVLAMTAAGIGWSLITPLCLLKSATLASRLIWSPIPGRRMRRELRLMGRLNERADVAALLQRAAVAALIEQCMPGSERILPSFASDITFVEPRDPKPIDANS